MGSEMREGVTVFSVVAGKSEGKLRALSDRVSQGR
ncbi:hypothetical protein COLO4_16291 [Corchorus olitorius]|uniref:Uncharacterized protein n=1 Tax=Corchorus olitorius TaxID=93759 RepID=A0A1R3JI77_9ROSI|nr:hypothetical protein COLO4_16291 [Corchorus olitorius]